MATPRRWSLRSRMLAIAAVSCVLAWLAGGIAMYAAVRREDALLFDARLADLARTLLGYAAHEVDEVGAADREAGALRGAPAESDIEDTLHGRYRYQIYDRAGRLVLASSNAPRAEPLAPPGHDGWVTRVLDGQALRVVSITAAGGAYRIVAAEPVADRLELADLYGHYLGVGFGLSALVLAAVTQALLRLALRPLSGVTSDLARRGPEDLRSVALDRLPDEFAPLLEAINQLMHRVERALRGEREFVAAAAHELRTPLAGLRAQAQLAAHERSGPAERAQALRAVQEGVDHAAHLVHQMLDLARSDALAGDPAATAARQADVALQPLFDEVMQGLAAAAAARGLRVRTRFEVAGLAGSPSGLTLMLRNLLANAVAHAAERGEVVAGSRRDGDAVLLWVEDDGPGIDPAERSRAFERFFRAKGNTQPGCGLGLAIVKALADAHGASATLGDSELGGLRAELRFPAQT
ncbi:MAG: sensor histidine kinase N-terminal domain-containing protein [Burkholderiales bacterium]|nr:sensor histidine kinase N-terminal domain-containing protein [Burkholderiales bacterium]MDE1926259.1 sensor histidine kinase N-terminal domain-containing protein [Burkholderiales bacterium]MDE2161041.1 sensor histidine kinase N-terminal domain-containing protein [Burkholderiales bacterium]MDE2502232.1 sensor histidine kinase N-terminal domain-containing protein [Burkholderiales bacterium]